MGAGRRRGWILVNLAALVMTQAPAALWAQVPLPFREPAIQVEPSPADPRKLDLPPGEALMDFAVSPAGADVAVLLRPAAGRTHVLLWQIASGETQRIWESDGPFTPHAMAWHPAVRALFLLGPSGQQSLIVRLDATSTGWKAATIFHTQRPLLRLIVGPRPFSSGEVFYRLFFGVARGDGTFLIASVTERGDRYYEVTKTKDAPPPAPIKQDEIPPEPVVAESALPEAFHPVGSQMLWVDGRQCFQAASYSYGNWGGSKPLMGGTLCGGSVEPTPNGIGLMHWHEGMAGVNLYLSGEGQPKPLAKDYDFISAPLSTPDGRGIIGVTRNGEALSVVYVPVDVPVANVANAWMFLDSSADRELFTKYAGLFRPASADQLYQLFDDKNYSCKGEGPLTPDFPHLVTTDIFWENFAAAYEGLFVLLERRQAIPSFWIFVREADVALAPTHSAWAKAFHAVAQLLEPHPTDPEAQRILRAGGVEMSSVLGRDFDFGELKPRGHYTASVDQQRYFQAFRYLMNISSPQNGLPATELQSLPPGALEHARIWIRSYLPFIAPSRSPLVWTGITNSVPAYARHPGTIPALFPLSFGFDNEVMLTTVFHPDWPPDQRIIGPGGRRLLPSGLDVAAALGSALARTLLADEVEKYPSLANALDGLKTRAPLRALPAAASLYDRWIEALAISWADSATIPGESARELWDVKRLQSGLASWATLRHATVLVNEREVAEAGEGGFEFIELAPPRGYVEPAPDTFEAIAGMFDAAATAVRNSPALEGGSVPSEDEKAPLRAGLLRRLAEAAAKARLFAGIARKEIRGEALSSNDYEEILEVNRVAEYHFLIFKSLANPEFALSKPDPMAKIADVAGGVAIPRPIPYLEAAVGAPLEWDQIVPYFGRREIVWGSVYSYYEFTSPAPLDDVGWRKRVENASRPAWVTPFISNKVATCPFQGPF